MKNVDFTMVGALLEIKSRRTMRRKKLTPAKIFFFSDFKMHRVAPLLRNDYNIFSIKHAQGKKHRTCELSNYMILSTNKVFKDEWRTKC